MGNAGDSVDEWAMPALLRAARRVYGRAIRDALAGAGFDDVPRNGLFVVGAIARTGAPLGEVIDALGVSKQAAGQLVDTLVLRGYLDRAVDPADRRRLNVTLTERGAAAAEIIRATIDRLDAGLEQRAGPEHVAITRATLASIVAAGSTP